VDKADIHTQEDSPVPVYLDWENKTNPVIKSLDCGLSNSFAVCEDGTAYSWGEGESGALAHGRIKKQGVSDDENLPDDQYRPKKIVLKKSKQEKMEGDTKIQMISVGATHSVLLVSQSQEL
jgi:alpha-tubulin suppressor-like RCC1 family protein